jgi:ankyrin repeat protein
VLIFHCFITLQGFVFIYLFVLPHQLYVCVSQTGRASLHYAARGGHADAVKLLLDAGANKDAISRDEVNPYTLLFVLYVCVDVCVKLHILYV